MRYGRRVDLICSREECRQPFQRRAVDIKRNPRDRIYCSRACFHATIRTGRTMADLVCALPSCGRPFQRIASEAKKHQKHWCSMACYQLGVDRVALGKAGGKVAHLFTSAEAKRERSSKAGKARAAKCSPEKLREIALKGVAARKAKGAAVTKKAAFTRKFGRLFAFGVPLGRGRNA